MLASLQLAKSKQNVYNKYKVLITIDIPNFYISSKCINIGWFPEIRDKIIQFLFDTDVYTPKINPLNSVLVYNLKNQLITMWYHTDLQGRYLQVLVTSRFFGIKSPDTGQRCQAVVDHAAGSKALVTAEMPSGGASELQDPVFVVDIVMQVNSHQRQQYHDGAYSHGIFYLFIVRFSVSFV